MITKNRFFSVGNEVLIVSGKDGPNPLQEFRAITIDGKAEVCSMLILRLPKPCIVVHSKKTNDKRLILDAVLLMIHILIDRFKKYSNVYLLKNKSIEANKLIKEGFSRHLGLFTMERSTIFRKKQEIPINQFDDVYINPYWVPWNLIPSESNIIGKLYEYIKEGDVVLDVGTGYGRNVYSLMESGMDVYGFDISPTAIRIARQITGLDEKLTVCTITATPYEDNKFDAILDVGCLHCLSSETLRNALTEMNRILKPGGHFISKFYFPRTGSAKKFGFGIVEDVGLTIDQIKKSLGDLFIINELTGHIRAGYFVVAKKEER